MVSARDATLDEVLRPGASFGRYVVQRRVGEGGMAIVVEALHAELQKRVALKVLHPAFAADAVARARFLQEARSAARLQHPHVVSVVDVGVHGELPYMVMEFLEGEDLRAVLDHEGVLAVERAVDLVLPVASAVAAVHAAGIVHRDIKPENVFLAYAPSGPMRPVLLDFGISKLLDAHRVTRLTKADHLVGTPLYMSPEQAAGAAQIDGRSDQYALGVILYECVTGVRPFTDDRSVWVLVAAILAGDFPPPRWVRPDLPPALEAVVLRAMSLAPSRRFASLAGFACALLPFASAAARARWQPEFDTPAVAADVAAERVAAARTESPTRVAVPRAATPGLRRGAATATATPGPRTVVLPPQALRAVPALRDCTDAELELFSVVAPARAFVAGAVLFRQGTLGESCFLLLEGEVDVVKSFDDGDRVLNTSQPGAVLGQVALVDRAPRTASVVTRVDSVAVELARDVFERLLEARSPLALRFQQHVAMAGIRQLRTATEQLAALLVARASAREHPSQPPAADASDDALAYVQAAVNEWELAPRVFGAGR